MNAFIRYFKLLVLRSKKREQVLLKDFSVDVHGNLTWHLTAAEAKNAVRFVERHNAL